MLAEPAYANLIVRVEDKQERNLDLEVILKAHDAPCVFFDISEMGTAEADCWEYGPGKCSVPGVDLLIVDTNCKDMSRKNAGSVRQELVLQIERSKGGNAQTFHGLFTYVERYRPLIILFQNINVMEDTSLILSIANLFHRFTYFFSLLGPTTLANGIF